MNVGGEIYLETLQKEAEKVAFGICESSLLLSGVLILREDWPDVNNGT